MNLIKSDFWSANSCHHIIWHTHTHSADGSVSNVKSIPRLWQRSRTTEGFALSGGIITANSLSVHTGMWVFCDDRCVFLIYRTKRNMFQFSHQIIPTEINPSHCMELTWTWFPSHHPLSRRYRKNFSLDQSLISHLGKAQAVIWYALLVSLAVENRMIMYLWTVSYPQRKKKQRKKRLPTYTRHND